MRKILSATSWQPAHYTVLSRVRLKRLWQHTEAVLIKQAFECSQVAISVLFGVIKKFLWWKPLFFFFKPLQMTAGPLPGCLSHHKQHICADASWFSASPTIVPGTAEQRPLLRLPLLGPRKRCAIANYRAGGVMLHSEGNNPAHSRQMWGTDGERCKTAAPWHSLVNLPVRQFESRAAVLLGPCLSRASAGDTSGRGSGEYDSVEQVFRLSEEYNVRITS